MLKVVIILILVGYVVYRVTNFIFSGLFRGFTRNPQYGRQQSRSSGGSRKAPNSNVNIDFLPNKQQKNPKGFFGGGEYVDYEEVK